MRNNSRVSLLAVSLSLSLIGCECRPPTVQSTSGSVRWEYVDADGMTQQAPSDTIPTATIQFPVTTMGGTRKTDVKVTNIGRSSMTLAAFKQQVVGAPTVLNDPNFTQTGVFRIDWDATTELLSNDSTIVHISFTPPVTMPEPTVAYRSEMTVVPGGAAESPITLLGTAIAGQCEVPELIDFGSLPLLASASSTIDLSNNGEAAITVTGGGVTGAPVGIFETTGIERTGELVVQPHTSPVLTVGFHANTEGDFTGTIKLKRGESCPERVVTVKGRGVANCVTWQAEPSDDARGQGLNFGAVQPNTSGPGKVTFSNLCSVAGDLNTMRTNNPVFVVTDPADGNLALAAAAKDATGMWVPGTAVAQLAFRPATLGRQIGVYLINTSFGSQAGISIDLKGFGGGPVIDVRPTPILAVGRIGFVPNSTPALFASRSLRVSNVGNRPTPPDPLTNLRLGTGGAGAPYWEVIAINGTIDELCVGEWDATTSSCSNTVGAALYDPALGIEATAGVALNVPVRVTPVTAGAKEWELVIYSNDVAHPDTHIRITAEAIEAPPCNYTVAPTSLDYGTMVSSETKTLTFAITNLGTQPTELCYVNGIGLGLGSDPGFTIPTNPVDVTLSPGQVQTVTVRAQPVSTAQSVTQVAGTVTFGISSPYMPQATVNLSANVSPACLTITPQPLPFGDTQLDCGGPTKAVVINNTCPQAVTLDSVVLADPALAAQGAGTCATLGGCPQFVLTSTPTPGVLNPGQSRSALMRFTPRDLGNAAGTLTVNVTQGGTSIPYNINLTGNGIARTQANCGVQVTCPGPITTGANSTVTLTPTVTSPGAVSCQWSINSRPNTSQGQFSSPQSCSGTTYDADVVGTHLVQFDVSDGVGGTGTCTVPVTVNPNGDLWIELTWNLPSDMDLHMLHPNAGNPLTAGRTVWFHSTWDVSYLNLGPTWNPSIVQENPHLDRDDVGGTGPENTRINSPALNTDYTIGVHSYGLYSNPAVLSTVKLYCGGSLITTQQHSSNVNKDMWVVGKVRFSASGTCAFTGINAVVAVP